MLVQELRHLPHPVDVALAGRDEFVRAVVEVQHAAGAEADEVLEVAKADEEGLDLERGIWRDVRKKLIHQNSENKKDFALRVRVFYIYPELTFLNSYTRLYEYKAPTWDQHTL